MNKRIAKRVLLVGWDAADWQIIRPLIAKGQMPALEKLIANGVSGNLATIQPSLSPMLWNSIATGKRADKHGICGFLEPKPDRSGIRPVSSTSRKCKALWNILSQSQMKSNVVSWFASHPAEPIRGQIVTDRYVAQVSERSEEQTFPAGTFHPSSLQTELGPLVVKPTDLEIDALLPFVPRAAQIDQKSDDRLIKLAVAIARVSTVHAAACRLAAEDDWDLMAVYYAAIDEFGHIFMPYHPPRLAGIPQRDVDVYGDVMVGCYRFHDMMLDALLAYAGPETTVLLISDHGFESGGGRPGVDARENPEQWHRTFGVACAQGPGIRKGDALYGATLLDVTPTILSLFGLPVGADMDGRPWLEIMEPHQPIATIDTWETVAGESGQHGDDVREDPVDSSEMIRRLVELGYVEAPSADAEESIRKVLRDRKINLAVALTASRRASKAASLWQELVDQFSNEPGFRIQLASCLIRIGRINDCKTVLASMDKATRESPYVRLMRATIEIEEGWPAVALGLVHAAISDAPDDVSVLNRAAELMLRANEWAAAADVYEKSLRIRPDNSVALVGLAQVRIRQERFEDAAELALNAVSLTHMYPAAHYYLGVALRGCDRNKDAINAMETAAAMGFRPNEVHAQLAKLYTGVDDAKSAEHAKRAQA